ncbi:MAG: hypothetical protein JXR10_01770 [Cyclobacteriaceae bacterium]
MLRVVSFLKFLSIVLFLIIIVLVYAYLPVMVDLEAKEGALQIRKENFFYFAIGIFVVVNIAMLGFQKLIEPKIASLDLKAWLRGLAFVVNIYLTLLAGFLGVLNNSGHLDVAGFSYLNYFGPILIFSWVIGLLYLIYKRP